MAIDDYLTPEQLAELARLRSMQSGLWPCADGTETADWRELSWADVALYSREEIRFLGERMRRDIHERRLRERWDRVTGTVQS